MVAVATALMAFLSAGIAATKGLKTPTIYKFYLQRSKDAVKC